METGQTNHVSFKQLGKLRLGRESLEKWINENDFESIIEGCFVRVLLGEKNKNRVYRIAVIKGVETSDQVYKIGDAWTHKLLVLNWGNAQRTFKMDFISNGEFTEDEYKEWIEQMKKCNLPIITAAAVNHKIKHIKNFVLSKRTAQDTNLDALPTTIQPAETFPHTEKSLSVPEPSQQQTNRIQETIVILDETGAPKKKKKVVAQPPPVVEMPPEPKQIPIINPIDAILLAKKQYEELKEINFDQNEFIHELEQRDSQFDEDLVNLRQKIKDFTTEWEVRRKEELQSKGEDTELDSMKDAETKIAEARRRYEEDLDLMKRECRRRDRIIFDVEDDIADIQKQLERAQAVANEERATLQDQTARKDKQLSDVQKQAKEKEEKLLRTQESLQQQQAVISLQDHTIQELENQLRTEHAQQIVTQQKRRKKAIILQQRISEIAKFKESIQTINRKITALINEEEEMDQPINPEEVHTDEMHDATMEENVESKDATFNKKEEQEDDQKDEQKDFNSNAEQVCTTVSSSNNDPKHAMMSDENVNQAFKEDVVVEKPEEEEE